MDFWIVLGGIVLIGILPGVAEAAPVVQVTVPVINEQGQSVEGAQANRVWGMGCFRNTEMI